MQICSNCGEQGFKPRIDLDSTDLRGILISAQTAAIVENIHLDLQDYDKESPCCEPRREIAARDKYRLRECLSLLSRSLPSPVQKLPDEILQIIFDYYCDTNRFEVTDPTEESAGQLIAQIPALVAASVCSRWRRNALAVSSIWSRISLACSVECDESHSDKLLRTLDLFIPRSRHWSLDIDIKWTVPMEDDIGDLAHLLKTLSDRLQPQRWRKLTFHAICAFDISSFFAYSVPSKFPLLEEITLGFEEFEGTEFMIELCHAAPKLKRIKYLFVSDLDDFPLTKLSHLDTGVFFIEDMEKIFRPDTRIASLRLADDLQLEPGMTVDFSTSAVSLTLTHIHYRWEREWASFFQCFTSPSLQTLHLEPFNKHHMESAPWPNVDHFLGFIRRSSCVLTTFSFQSLPLSDSDLISILTQLPALLNLTIIDTHIPTDLSPITPKLFESLHAAPSRTTASQPGPPIIPKLHTLILHIDAQTFEDVPVVEMVKSRWNPSVRSGTRAAGESCSEVDCLRECTIKFHNRDEPEIGVYGSLDVIEKEGMRLVVSWKTG